MHHKLLISSPVYGYLPIVAVGFIKNKAAIHMHAEVFLWTYPFTYFGKCLGVEGLGPIYKVLENSNMFAEQTCESLYSPTNNEAVLLWNHTARFIVVSHCGLSFF